MTGTGGPIIYFLHPKLNIKKGKPSDWKNLFKKFKKVKTGLSGVGFIFNCSLRFKKLVVFYPQNLETAINTFACNPDYLSHLDRTVIERILGGNSCPSPRAIINFTILVTAYAP